MTLEQVWSEIRRLHRDNDMFTEEQCRTVNQLIDKANKLMATKVKATIKDGKVKPADTTPAPLRKGKAMKAARVEKGLKANREKHR